MSMTSGEKFHRFHSEDWFILKSSKSPLPNEAYVRIMTPWRETVIDSENSFRHSINDVSIRLTWDKRVTKCSS